MVCKATPKRTAGQQHVGKTLWKWHEHDVKAAVSKLQKKHPSALLLLTLREMMINVILVEALLQKAMQKADITREEGIQQIKSLVSLFIDMQGVASCLALAVLLHS